MVNLRRTDTRSVLQPSFHDAPAPPIRPPESKVAGPEPRQPWQDGRRPLNAWEQYKALNDAMDEIYEVIGISNREARFALLVMGILNAFVVIAASRPEVVGALSGVVRASAAVLLGIYAVTAVYFLFQAIEALRPGQFRPRLDNWAAARDDAPIGIRYFEDVIARDALGHRQAWHDVHVDQLNAELAVQHHSLCLKSNVRRAALRRLFAGLRLMTMLVIGLMILFVSAIWF
jgi:hypothetical protein